MISRTPPLRYLVVIAALTLLIAACGTDDGSADGDGDTNDDDPGSMSVETLTGRSFWSTEITEDGEPRVLVDGTRIEIRFDADPDPTIGASAGCNSMGGRYRLDDGVLVATEFAMTEIGCDPERHAQDEFVVDLLTGSPRIELDGDQLVVTRDTPPTVVATFVDRAVADPDRPIVGTEWEITGAIDGEVATGFGVDEPATLRFPDQSTFTGFDGCNPMAGNVELSDGSVGGPVDPDHDGELQIGSLDLATIDCDGPAGELAAAVHQFFANSAGTFDIDGPSLTLLGADGAGLTLRAR